MNWIVDIVVMIVLARGYTVYAFGGRAAVNGHSMEPVLASGDVVLLNRLAYDLGKPNRFDIIAFRQGDSAVSIKRVIGLPGETVQIRDQAVYINGERLEAEGGLEDVSIAGAGGVPCGTIGKRIFCFGRQSGFQRGQPVFRDGKREARADFRKGLAPAGTLFGIRADPFLGGNLCIYSGIRDI